MTLGMEGNSPPSDARNDDDEEIRSESGAFFGPAVLIS